MYTFIVLLVYLKSLNVSGGENSFFHILILDTTRREEVTVIQKGKLTHHSFTQ